MKNCNGCKHAEWKKTKKGRLHPSGDGICKVKIKIPVLPQAFMWSPFGKIPRTNQFLINRRKEFKDHCAYYSPGKPEGGEG